MMKPLFVKAVGRGNTLIETFEPQVLRKQIASEKNGKAAPGAFGGCRHQRHCKKYPKRKL